MTTINDVAKLAGVSKAAISRYLSGTLKPKEETIKRIEAAIAQTNYIPNRMAASIRTKTSNTIAIVIPASKNIAFAEISDAINEEIAQYGYSMVTYTTNEKIEQERLASYKIRENRFDGAIFITEPEGDKDMSHIDLLEESGIKTLMINRHYEPNKYSTISVDISKGLKDVLKYLTEIGYKKIGLILGWRNQDQSSTYKKAYEEQMKEMNKTVDENLILYSKFEELETRNVVKELIKNGADAIYTASDRLALIALEVLEEKNIEIPEQMAVVGYGNTQFSKLVKMTSLDGKGEQIGKEAAQMLLKKLRGLEEEKFQLLDTSLVVRKTTR
ncbi:MAG: LacI family transcriptional regulator [Fusobacteria bacterium]|nr:MAG: LacI family transcriptional regulator [Fusobacteriota bacterium]KAF0228751.1 MAG: LacI family transcriptional [Fusobacteriota bacterium]